MTEPVENARVESRADLLPEELAAGIKDARSCVFNAGHMLHVELPRTFNQAVLGFLAEVDGDPAPESGGMPLPCGQGLGV
jgi:hypothetical protein